MKHTFLSVLFIPTAILLVIFSETKAQEITSDSMSVVEPAPMKAVKESVDHSIIGANRLGPRGQDKEMPIMSFLNTTPLELIFDDLRNDYTEYHYDFVHCDRNWIPLDQTISDFYQGFPNQVIEEVEFSSATKLPYATYRLSFPPEDERFLQSGNYLIRIFEEDRDDAVIIRRFTVLDPKVNVKAEVVPPVETKHRNYKQELRFKIYDNNGIIQDLNELYVTAIKNGSWEINCSDFKPSFVSGEEIVFDHNSKCLFEGGNEFRDVNFIDFKSMSMDIVKVLPAKGASYDLYLEEDQPRSYLKYADMVDMNGRVDRRGQHRSFPWRELDYARVHFTLATEEPMLGFEIYLYGEFSLNSLDTYFRMEFNPSNGRYEKEILLKQGYYNYEYAVKTPYQNQLDEGLIEGSHYDTENDYTLFIYYKSRLDGYDRLIGLEQINSRKKLDE